MKQFVEIESDLFYSGIYAALKSLLNYAQDGETDAFEALRDLAVDLKDSPEWRSRIKRAEGWDEYKTAWAALEGYIAKNRTDDPWWDILKFADGANVPWFTGK
jgi:hypothetical protein